MCASLPFGAAGHATRARHETDVRIVPRDADQCPPPERPKLARLALRLSKRHVRGGRTVQLPWDEQKVGLLSKEKFSDLRACGQHYYWPRGGVTFIIR